MMRCPIPLGLAVATLGLAAGGCGSSDSSGSSEKDRSGENESARTACKAKATSKPTGLQPAFPVPGELTVTQVRKDGPTTVVDGYWTSGIDEAYREFKDHVEQAGYKVLFDEKEDHEAEISYNVPNRTGHIALRDDCTES